MFAVDVEAASSLSTVSLFPVSAAVGVVVAVADAATGVGAVAGVGADAATGAGVGADAATGVDTGVVAGAAFALVVPVPVASRTVWSRVGLTKGLK